MTRADGPGSEKGYALDFDTPVSYVATLLEGARHHGGSLTVEDLAKTYRGFGADLSRIMVNHNIESETGAARFLLTEAAKALVKRKFAETDGDGYRLVKPLAEIKWKGKKLPVWRLTDSVLGDPFNPRKSGGFADGIRRSRSSADEANLRDSMTWLGWVDSPHLRALQDERGVVIDGRRRLRIAEELGLPPRIDTVAYGTGDAADAQRLKHALAHNHDRLTKLDRKYIAERILGAGAEWSWADIGRMLDSVAVKPQTNTRKRGEKKQPYWMEERWQEAAKPLLDDLQAGRITRQDVIDELKAAGLRASNGTLDTFGAYLRGETRDEDETDDKAHLVHIPIAFDMLADRLAEGPMPQEDAVKLAGRFMLEEAGVEIDDLGPAKEYALHGAAHRFMKWWYTQKNKDQNGPIEEYKQNGVSMLRVR